MRSGIRPLVVIPVYNERDTIQHVVDELGKCFQGDLLVVDDGSTDGSSNNLTAPDGIALCIRRHEPNRGYGAALINGFKLAGCHGYSHVVTLDCDWQHEPCEVPRFLDHCQSADIVSGSRYLPESEVYGDAPESRVEINRMITARLNAITSFGLTDAFCGLKSYSVEALKKLTLTELGYGFPLELWLQAWKQGLTVKELAVARIYTGVKRSFGGTLDNPAERLAYYETIIRREVGR